MTSKTISLYSNIKETKNGKDIPIDVLLQYIQDGHWQDPVLAVQTGKRSKESLPYVTVSGKFSERKASGLIEHSGFICIDVDDVEPNELKSIICADKYVYSAFTSVSGKGVALLFRINPEKHNEAFEGLQDYLFNSYQIIIDPSCRDISRARFISWDPDIYINNSADKFVSYVKRKVITKVPDVIFVQSDFDQIVKDIVTRRVDITGDYNTWLRLGFAICDKFGDGGRQYFHLISQYHSQYTPQICDRQFTNCLKANRQGVTIATFYYLAKEAGITIVSEKTKIISRTAYLAKKSRSTPDAAVKVLQDAEGITPAESIDIVNQVFENNIEIDTDENTVEALEMWLKQNYEVKYNEIAKRIEINGVVMEDRHFNSIYIAAKKVFDKGVTKELLDSLIDSDFTQVYNPVKDFLELNKERKPVGAIKSFFETLETDTGLFDFPNYATYFGTKWLVSIIASVYGTYSNYMLVLTGPQNTGKTTWCRTILPAELQKYFAETKFENGKDDELLMSTKLILFDDEMSGKTHKEEKSMKHRLDKRIITIRRPFKRFDADLQRLAVFCGSTNTLEVLHDPTGNRRYLPINVLSIDFNKLNSIDRTDIFIEAYHLYNSGFDWRLSSDDIQNLNSNTQEFEGYSIEYDILTKYFKYDSKSESLYTTADVMEYLQRRSNLKLSEWQIKREFKRLKWEQRKTSHRNRNGRFYPLVEIMPFVTLL